MVYVFYLDHRDSGDYYKIAVKADSREDVENYLDTISREVVFCKEVEDDDIKNKGDRKVPCGTIVQYKYYGRILPKGIGPDKRYGILR